MIEEVLTYEYTCDYCKLTNTQQRATSKRWRLPHGWATVRKGGGNDPYFNPPLDACPTCLPLARAAESGDTVAQTALHDRRLEMEGSP